MSYILTISEKTKQDTNELGDIVSIQNVKPSDKEYEVFTIHEREESALDLWDICNSFMPEKYKTTENPINFKSCYDGMTFSFRD